MGKILTKAQETASLLGGLRNDVSTNTEQLQLNADNVEALSAETDVLMSRCDSLDDSVNSLTEVQSEHAASLAEHSNQIGSITEHLDGVDTLVEALRLKDVQVVSDYPITGDGVHLVMDDKGLKAVTAWDSTRGYRRIVYNRDPVVYVEASADDQIIINSELVQLARGSNYLELDALLKECKFCWYDDNEDYPPCGHNVTAVVIKCSVPSDLSTGNYQNWFGAYGCSILKNLEIPITADVTKLNGFVTWCWDLEHINCGAWDTSGVTSMTNMFMVCWKLNEVHSENWDTSRVTSMSNAFVQCLALKYIDVSNWNVANVTNFSQTFLRVGKDLPVSGVHPTIDVSKWDTSKATKMSGMFYDTQYTNLVGIENLKVDKVTNMYDMLGNNQTLVRLDLSAWNPIAVTNTSEMFYYCKKLEYLDLSSFDMTKVTNVSSMFTGCSSLVTLIFPQMGKFKAATTFYLNSCPLSKESLDSIFTYDRVANSLDALTVKLTSSSKALLTEEEIAAITAKGYTIA